MCLFYSALRVRGCPFWQIWLRLHLCVRFVKVQGGLSAAGAHVSHGTAETTRERDFEGGGSTRIADDEAKERGARAARTSCAGQPRTCRNLRSSIAQSTRITQGVILVDQAEEKCLQYVKNLSQNTRAARNPTFRNSTALLMAQFVVIFLEIRYSLVCGSKSGDESIENFYRN